MRKLPFFVLLFFSVAACNGAVDDDDQAAARCAAPPAAAVTTRSDMLRLDVVELGERRGNVAQTSASIGMNLDGRCSTTARETHACVGLEGGLARFGVDGPDGVDNTFGTVILPLLLPFDATPSAGAGGTSFLVFEGEGRATLHLGTRAGHTRAIIPLTSVRTAAGPDGLVTLAAIIPRDAFAQSIRAHANVLLDETSTELCAGSALEQVVATIEQAADVPLGGGGDPSAICDGISIGFRFRATPANAPPAIPPTCAEQLENERDR